MMSYVGPELGVSLLTNYSWIAKLIARKFYQENCKFRHEMYKHVIYFLKILDYVNWSFCILIVK